MLLSQHRNDAVNGALGRADFERARELMYRHSGVVLETKHTLVEGRLRRRMRALGLSTFRDYLDLVESGAELPEFVNALTTNKTGFFREPHHFDTLRARARELLDAGQTKLRVWSAACSSGQEPYSIAMVLADVVGSAPIDVRILASDIDTNILAKAEEAKYTKEEVSDVPLALRKFLEQTGRGEYEVAPRIRELVTFRQINLVEQPYPIKTAFDFVFCRNVMIYFDKETQTKIARGLAGALSPRGLYFAGHSETLHFMAEMLVPVAATGYTLRGNAPPRRIKTPGPIPSASSARVRKLSSAKLSSAKLSSGRHRAAPPAPPPGPPKVPIKSGELHTSARPALITTVLGSCVAACLYDPVARVGGMNHFMLPEHPAGHLAEDAVATRFGVHAMELLINGMLAQGAAKERLVAKLFGAANVVTSDDRIARDNAAFARSFLSIESIPIVAESMGGNLPMIVHFDTATGKARVKTVEAQLAEVRREEARFLRSISSDRHCLDMQVTLFGGG